MSYQKKDRRGHTHISSFWYDNDSDRTLGTFSHSAAPCRDLKFESVSTDVVETPLVLLGIEFSFSITKIQMKYIMLKNISFMMDSKINFMTSIALHVFFLLCDAVLMIISMFIVSLKMRMLNTGTQPMQK